MKKSKNPKKVQAHQYVDTEYEIEFKDVLEIIKSCTEEEKSEIRKIVCVDDPKYVEPDIMALKKLFDFEDN